MSLRDQIYDVLRRTHSDGMAVDTLDDIRDWIMEEVDKEPDYTTPADAVNALCKVVHEANATWWKDPATGQPKERNVGELLALMHSEISEALEGHRKNLPDDKLPHRRMFHVELVDALIRIFDALGAPQTGTPEAGKIFEEKMAYNAQRADHKPESRLQENGKKY